MANDDTFIVAAIDFGTTFSGYAFSFRHEFEKDPTRVSSSTWTAGARALISLKTPTCVLCNPEGMFHSFGYDAENKYSQLAEEGNHKNWFYFKRFKMMLFDTLNLKRDISLEDDNGNSLPAKTIFTMAIRYLKDHLLQTSSDRFVAVKASEIQWVITVPAIWNDSAKQFMREAATDAGVDNERLIIALEPEAASLLCRHLPSEHMVSSKNIPLSSLQPGSKYMVVDCGGGTVDVTVHQVLDGGQLKELHSASGGAWGGTRVDEAFRLFFIKLVGDHVFQTFQNRHPDCYITLFRELEIKKREICPETAGKVMFRVPISLKETIEEESGKELKAIIEAGEFAGQVVWAGDKMKVESNIIKTLFHDATINIVRHIRELLKSPNVEGTDVLLMVGGFSESPMLQQVIQRHFPEMNVMIPKEAGLVVLKGAVIFGFKPFSITERVCKFTYGVVMNEIFDETKHPQSKKTFIGGQWACADVFSRHVEIGQTVRAGETLKEVAYTPADETHKHILLDVYASTKKAPMFVTNTGCTKLGNMMVTVPDASVGGKRKVFVRMLFGGTELSVEARVEATGEITKGKFDMLG